MKKLQNNFTTPEQSKWLLKLGVPEDSANCYLFDEITYNDDFVSKPEVIFYKDKFSDVQKRYNRAKRKLLPCWSVGRLMEIFSKCYTGTKCYYSPRNLYKTEFWIERFNRLSKIGFIDFSKLEEL